MTPEQIQEAILKGIAEAIKPLTTQVNELVLQVKPVAELQEQVKGLVEADSAREIAGKGNKDSETGKGKTTEQPGALTADAVAKLVNDGIAAALKTRDDAASATAQSQSDLSAFLAKNAPKLKDSALAKRLFAGTKSDEERKAVLMEYIESATVSGKAPDLGASAEGEGGQKSQADSAEAKKAAAMEAAKGLKPATL